MYNFTCVFVYTSCAVKYADNNSKNLLKMRFTAYAGVSLFWQVFTK
jgi:hypothetical protein